MPGRAARAVGRTDFRRVLIISIKCNNGFCSYVTASGSFCKHLRVTYTTYRVRAKHWGGHSGTHAHTHTHTHTLKVLPSRC